MILEFDELKQYDFSLSDIGVILQSPSYRCLRVKGRPCNGFLYLRHGSCRYTFEDGEFSLSEGAVAYLPDGSHHTLTITSENFQFYRIDFTLRINGELAHFSDHPIKLSDQASPECAEAIMTLERDYGIGENTVIKTQKLCTIFASLQKSTVSTDMKRLMPALQYLQEHAVGEVNCGELADLCFLGSSRFYDLFRAELGMTPLEYRDRLILRRATSLLAARDLSVSEIAFAVGFENAAYFSRFFKKHMEISPSEYAKKQK